MNDTRTVVNLVSSGDIYKVMRVACCGAMDNVLANFPDVHTSAEGINAVAEGNYSGFSSNFLTEDPGKLRTLFMEFYQYGYDAFAQYLEQNPAIRQRMRSMADEEQTRAIGMMADASLQAYALKRVHSPKKARGKRLKKKKGHSR